MANFTRDPPLRVVISTVTFGMGMDVRLIVHLKDIKMYVQEVGRDGSESFTLLVHSPKLLTHCSDQMIRYARNATTCRRDELFADFNKFCHSEVNSGCMCCDICPVQVW